MATAWASWLRGGHYLHDEAPALELSALAAAYAIGGPGDPPSERDDLRTAGR